ncbi:MAG: hypothetical protein R6U57_12320 [Anaerolineales bacterium]
MLRRFLNIISLAIIILSFAACSLEKAQQATYYVVDPRFKDLYQQLKGDEVLGQPISNKKFVAGTNIEKQYFEAAVMVYDPDSSPRYYLEPVGLEAGFSDLPNADPENPNVKYVNGYIIPMEFAKLYEELGAARWVGLPLTRARKNPEKGIIEQYFENMGFFRFEDDPPGVVRLLPYGLWKCAGECSQYPTVENASLVRSSPTLVDSPFKDVIARLGSTFTGSSLTEAYRAEDGHLEQIFTNVVIYQDPDSALGVALRPIAEVLGIEKDPLESKATKTDMYFRELEDGKGFYIPSYFVDFVSRYSGFELSGEPITQLREIRNGVFRQCFQNYCLRYDSAGKEGERISLVPLGQKYKGQVTQRLPVQSAEADQARDIVLDVWEQSPQVSSSEHQQIGACIHEGDTPLTSIQVELNLMVPQENIQTYQLPPTDDGGCSFYELDPIQAQNGTTVDYQVCFLGINDSEQCKRDSFLIWGNESPPDEVQPTNTAVNNDERNIILDVWELNPQIPSSESQEIGACIHKGDQPLKGLDAELKVGTPQNGVIFYQTSPTDDGGCSFFRMDPITAKNGSTIPYQVCFTNQEGEKMCKRDSFLIWGNP